MSTKPELLEKLTDDQLKEIARAEGIELPRTVEMHLACKGALI